MGPCRCKLLFVIKHRWTLQFSPLANVRAKNLRLPDVEAGLNLHCLIFLNLITGDIINFFFSAVMSILIVVICSVCVSLWKWGGRDV